MIVMLAVILGGMSLGIFTSELRARSYFVLLLAGVLVTLLYLRMPWLM